MLVGTVLLGAALLFSPPAAAGPKTDVLYMKNGDRMTVEIKTMDAGALYVSLDYVDGTIAVEWSRIARVESTRLFLVEMDDGSVFNGHIAITPIEGTDSVVVDITVEDGTHRSFEKSRIAGLSSTAESFWGRLNGNLSSGVSFTKGNQTTTYNISSNVNYPRPRWSAAVGFNSNLSSTSGTNTSTRNQLNLSGAHLMRWNNWFYTGFAGALQSAEQQIDLQTSLGGGFGRFLKKTSNVRASLVGGLVWQATSYNASVTTTSSQSMLGLMLLGNMNLVQFKRQSLTLSANAIPSLSEPGRFYFNTNASYFLKLFGAVNWNLSFYGNWDTRPPPGTSGSDYGLNSGLSWTFGNR
jgi:hypothetical protein